MSLVIGGVALLGGLLTAPPHVPPQTDGMGGPEEPAGISHADQHAGGNLPSLQETLLDAPNAGRKDEGRPVSGDKFAAPAHAEANMIPLAAMAVASRPDSVVYARTVLTIAGDQSFYEALQQAGVPHGDIMALVDVCKQYRDLRRVQRGNAFRLQQDPAGSVRSLSFDLDLESYLVFVRTGDTFAVQELTYPVQRLICGVSGSITSSLYGSLAQIDAPVSLASKMNDVLGWEIDFRRDVRKGDTYTILYEEMWKDGEFVRTGSILALEYRNRKRSHTAFRFVSVDDKPGYFDAEGQNLQKQLLRAPLEYSRISSGYSGRRFHPILKKYMPHLGIDYAAPVGTPVRAAGDGTISEAGRRKGNGRYLKIRHNNSAYESYYLHLSRYAKGIKKGSKVQQGQVIGHVGASGYATGPHLDYRVAKNGTFVNPRRLKLPSAEPVPAAERQAFDDMVGLFRESLLAVTPELPPQQIALAHTLPPPLWQPPRHAAVLAPATSSSQP